MSSCTVSWYRSSYGTDFENFEVASPVLGPCNDRAQVKTYRVCIRQVKGMFG